MPAAHSRPPAAGPARRQPRCIQHPSSHVNAAARRQVGSSNISAGNGSGEHSWRQRQTSLTGCGAQLVWFSMSRPCGSLESVCAVCITLLPQHAVVPGQAGGGGPLLPPHAVDTPALLCPAALPWRRDLEETADMDEDAARLLAGANGNPEVVQQRMRDGALPCAAAWRFRACILPRTPALIGCVGNGCCAAGINYRGALSGGLRRHTGLRGCMSAPLGSLPLSHGLAAPWLLGTPLCAS